MGNLNLYGVGAVFGFLAVATGAFGAHGLQDRLDPHMLTIWETAARYQMYHALALLALGAWAVRNPNASVALPAWAFTIGTVVFSGSLYVLALSGIKILGAVTPFGGIALMIGWVSFAVQAFRSSQ